MTEGFLDVGFGHHLWWRVDGPQDGVPVVVLHGGPGSGTSDVLLEWCDPRIRRVVRVDQRNCGRSRPHAGQPVVDLSHNTTADLIDDLECLREHLLIERWIVAGVSWGTTLALAYAQAHPGAVAGMVLVAVVTTGAAEVEWITRGMGVRFPRQWEQFVSVLPLDDGDGNLAASYHRLLMDPDPEVHASAAAAWCAWEDTHVAVDGRITHNPRYDDPAFRLCFARIVTHYWSHAAFLPDGQLLDQMGRLAGIPGVLVHGARDLSSPASVARAVHAAWPHSQLVIVDESGHGLPPVQIRQAIDEVIGRSSLV